MKSRVLYCEEYSVRKSTGRDSVWQDELSDCERHWEVNELQQQESGLFLNNIDGFLYRLNVGGGQHGGVHPPGSLPAAILLSRWSKYVLVRGDPDIPTNAIPPQEISNWVIDELVSAFAEEYEGPRPVQAEERDDANPGFIGRGGPSTSAESTPRTWWTAFRRPTRSHPTRLKWLPARYGMPCPS
ncbi:uncharacterized protein N7515_002880 [Penicillium bovifimosum]|uniref:Uncharacterized protein n=1 Tax=Penicillium bovifimosum TaxID=126998 RepID=A0A9W9L9N9_9EURO|nr:uncharacterized protein N7515_002880 [Penicillium bovifimosum]KAJ5144093.1 hypothetical protein N7515_002880 [Penicillium bovifimosum]